MIVRCEECKSEFNLDESKLKESGSKVRCSVCESVFKVFPPKPDELPEEDSLLDEALEETVALDSPPVFDEDEKEEMIDEVEGAFEKAFEDALEDEGIEDLARKDDSEPTVALDSPPDLSGGDESEAPGEPETGPGKPEKRRRSSRIFLIPLIIVLIAIIVFLAIFFAAPNLLPDSLSFLKPVNKEDIIDTGVRRLTFKDVNGSFARSNKAGQLFVVRGTVINDDSKSRSSILLKGLILDDKGETVKRKLAYAGNTFTEKELQGMSVEKIEEGMKNREGKDGRNMNIASGGTVPFMIVFTDLPDNLSEFIVEAVSSSTAE